MATFYDRYIRGLEIDIGRLKERADTEQDPEIKAKLVRRIKDARELLRSLQKEAKADEALQEGKPMRSYMRKRHRRLVKNKTNRRRSVKTRT